MLIIRAGLVIDASTRRHNMGETNVFAGGRYHVGKNYDAGRFEISSDGVLKSYEWRDGDVETELIPLSVKKIESRAFMGPKAENMAFSGESPESIGCEAFKDCKRLRFVTLPKGVKPIADGAFCGCECLGELRFRAVSRRQKARRSKTAAAFIG